MSETHAITKCARCSGPSAKRRNEANYCLLHYRILQMRHDSAGAEKVVPSWQELEALFTALHDMRCPVCERPMNLLASQGRSTIVTLQHDRSGSQRLICLGCNVKHQYFPEDTFYAESGSNKYCRSCCQIKPRSEFGRHRSHQNGLQTYCRSCAVRHAVVYKQLKRGTFVGPMPKGSP